MSPKKQPCKSASCSASLTVPELKQSKTTVLNMLASATASDPNRLGDGKEWEGARGLLSFWERV
jgi:hypothetical protein